MKQPKYHYDIEQGTEEWLSVRLGIVTASEMNNIITPKGAPTKNEKMRSYACQIAAEREFAFIEDHYESYDMMRGTAEEGNARDVYNETYDEVKQCGFITREIDGITVGASPDGLVGDDGCIEIKSRKAKFQVQTILSGEVPAEYMNQIQAVLLISGREWCDFIQYSNGLPLFVKRVTVDHERQDKIKTAIIEFEKVVVEYIEGFRVKSSGLVKTERVEVVFADDMITEA